MRKATYLLLATCCLLLASCATTKHKRTEIIKKDSTAIERSNEVHFKSADQISTREIFFTANKFTEIDWIRDTLYKDTVIYKPRIRIAEQQQQHTKDSSVQHIRDTIYQTKEKIVYVRQESKVKEKDKKTKLPVWMMAIPFIIAILLFRCTK